MTEAERLGFGARLGALLRDLETTLRDSESRAAPVSLDDPIGRLSRMNAMQQQQMAQAQARHAKAELAAVRHALRRVENGSFGDCLDCGEEIDPRRLAARPAVTLCMGCQRAREG